MWNYVLRRLLASVPVFLGILFLLMLLLREGSADPVHAFLGKGTTVEDIESVRRQLGLDRPLWTQYVEFLGEVLTLDFRAESWTRPGQTVGELLASAAVPTLALTVPSLLLTSLFAISVGLLAAHFRGRPLDRIPMALAVMGMSVSFLVYVILGQYFGAYRLNEWLGFELFAVEGFDPTLQRWFHDCALPVAIGVVVALGYDARYDRAVMVEEYAKDYVTTARAKGLPPRRILFVHVLKNALVPIVSRIMTTLPFLIMGSVLLESFFNIPGMGNLLLVAIEDNDFPVIQAFTAVFAAAFVVTNLLTDVLYAWVDPRIRFS